jgi:glycosyltransferase involved in cell wall biosynthesis
MKILLNGLHWGGNTPPFVKKFKELGHTVKLICPYALNSEDLYEMHKLSEDLEDDDIIFPSYNFVDTSLLKLLDFISKVLFKLKLPQLYVFKIIGLIKSSRIKVVIHKFSPDIIYNHTFSEQTTFMMIMTGYKPQVSFPFGSDIMGIHARKNFNIHQKIIKESEYVIAALPDEINYFINELKVPEHKIPKPIPIGLPNLDDIIDNNIVTTDILFKYNIPKDKIKLLDVRGLRRRDGGALTLLSVIYELNNPTLHVILTKGYGGNSAVVSECMNLIDKFGLKNQVTLIEEELSYNDQIGLFSCSDINFSLLPHDGLGKSIMEAIAKKCLLVLTNLTDYKIAFNNNAEYVEHENIESIKNAIIRSIELPTKEKEKRIDENINWLKKNQDFDKNCQELINLFTKTIQNNLV